MGERKKERRGERDGVRKAALLLSILDSDSAAALLERFEPDVAREIADEARCVGSVSPEDVDAVVAEFLTLGEERNAETSVVPNDDSDVSDVRGSSTAFATSPEWKKSPLFAAAPKDSSDGGSRTGGDFCPLDALDPDSLATALRGEPASTVAAALARVDDETRAAVLQTSPNETRAAVERWSAALASVKSDGTPFSAARALEDAVFNAGLDCDEA